MMATHRTSNRAMFWRIIRRLFGANPGRLFVMLLALGAGAAVTAALLNLQVDAKQRLTSELRAFGANVIIAPPNISASAAGNQLLSESLMNKIPTEFEGRPILALPFLYLVAQASSDTSQTSIQAVLAGTDITHLPQIGAGWRFEPLVPAIGASAPKLLTSMSPTCAVGVRAAERLKAILGAQLTFDNAGKRASCDVVSVITSGGPEDNQIFTDMAIAQELASLSSRVSLILVSAEGTPGSIGRFISTLAKSMPDADVHGIRQFTEGEAKIYNRISGLLTATVAIVLVLTGLCVMAAMTNVAMERKNDVGLMKAIGGSVRRVLRLFLAEAALLGLAGGMIGGAAGIFLSIGLGKAVFGVAARPRLIVYPVAVALTIIVAILSAYPLRRLASIRPASVFRGEA
jgi:putative ABC transport system permease protein